MIVPRLKSTVANKTHTFLTPEHALKTPLPSSDLHPTSSKLDSASEIS